MFPYLTDTVSVSRRIKVNNATSIVVVVPSIWCNIQPLTSDDLLYDIEIKKYNCFLPNDNQDLILTNDILLDQTWRSYTVNTVDWFRWPTINTFELVLILNK